MAGIGEALDEHAGGVHATTRPQRHPDRDVELVARIARGEGDAFAELYDRYGAVAYRLAHRITRDPQLAETVVQEAFLAIWRQADRFDGRRARPSTWVLTITHHRAVDVVRAEQLRRTEPADRLVELVDESVDLARDAVHSEQRDQVARALAGLPGAQRRIIELAYFEGYSQSQLARLLEEPLGTIKSRTQTALARLRVALEHAGVTAELAST
jgi:RNA polymerase sigma factor (sigma-70 family)